MLGVHFAVNAEQEQRLLAADDEGDAAVGEFLEDIEESWNDADLKVDTDKAWDAIHRCLGDGSLDPDGAEYPLSHAVLGGRQMGDDDSYLCYLTATEARDVAEALHRIDEVWLRERFDAIDDDYAGPHDDEDFADTWENFVDLRAFYGRAAGAGRAVIFTAT